MKASANRSDRTSRRPGSRPGDPRADQPGHPRAAQAFDIAEVAARTNLPASTLRFYEEKGLITSTGRSGLRRLFAPLIFERLALIAIARAAGFSLDEIRAMFAADGRPVIDRALLTAKADELDATIRKLTTMRDGLRHAAACKAPSHLECPTFRRLLRAASAGALGPREQQQQQAAKLRQRGKRARTGAKAAQ